MDNGTRLSMPLGFGRALLPCPTLKGHITAGALVGKMPTQNCWSLLVTTGPPSSSTAFHASLPAILPHRSKLAVAEKNKNGTAFFPTILAVAFNRDSKHWSLKISP